MFALFSKGSNYYHNEILFSHHRHSLEYNEDCVIFLKVDVDVASDVSHSMSIRQLPTFLLIKDGKQVSSEVVSLVYLDLIPMISS